MAKKDTTDAVLSMLGDRGASFRPTGNPPPAQREPVESAKEEVHAPEPVSPSSPPVRSRSSVATARRARKSQVKPAVKSDPTENAPRTLRLSQPMANSLREAWLDAKRDDVLLTYQDFADQVVRAGLRRR